MNKLVFLIFLAAYGVCYISARDLINNTPRAVNIVLGDLPPNYNCECKATELCNPTIFIAREVCPNNLRCCLIDQEIDLMETNEIVQTPDTIPPPLGIYLDRTPPNHSCVCDIFFRCTSKIYVRNISCENSTQACCLHVGQELPLIDYPTVYRRIFGIGEYAYLHSMK